MGIKDETNYKRILEALLIVVLFVLFFTYFCALDILRNSASELLRDVRPELIGAIITYFLIEKALSFYRAREEQRRLKLTHDMLKSVLNTYIDLAASLYKSTLKEKIQIPNLDTFFNSNFVGSINKIDLSSESSMLEMDNLAFTSYKGILLHNDLENFINIHYYEISSEMLDALLEFKGKLIALAGLKQLFQTRKRALKINIPDTTNLGDLFEISMNEFKNIVKLFNKANPKNPIKLNTKILEDGVWNEKHAPKFGSGIKMD